MAACSRIETSLQAYIDDELGASERVIVEEHLANCKLCRASLREHQRTSALLFEAFAGDRLRRPLRQRVLENLPEFDPIVTDIEEVNWRAKHPSSWMTRLSQLAPITAVAVLVFLTILLRSTFPEQQRGTKGVVGVVTSATGEVNRTPTENSAPEQALVRTLVKPGDRFYTRGDTKMMLSLRGPTLLKMDENTRIRINDRRWVELTDGRIWLNVGKDGTQFRVSTPAGLVTVVGTVFSVAVTSGKTVVTVEEGEVHVNNADHMYKLTAGRQVAVDEMGSPADILTVDAVTVHAWATPIQPTEDANAVFASLESNVETAEVAGRPVWAWYGMSASETLGLRIYWTPDEIASGHCSYDVLVLDGEGNTVLRSRLDGSVFANKGIAYFDVEPEQPIKDLATMIVRLVPDYTTGSIETQTFDVKAQVVDR